MGRILNNRYEILEKIDETDRVMLYKARVLSSNRLVTVKVLKPKMVKKKEFVKRFTDELAVMTNLNHSGLITVLDVNYEKGLYYVTMEYFEGASLYEIIVRDMPLTVPQALNIVMQLGKVLNYALINGVKFRTIKFSNIIVNRIGRVKVLSFSTPRSVTAKSPLPIKEPVGIASDIFFLGVALYALLEGDFPRDSKNTLITDAYAFDPDDTEVNFGLSNRIMPAGEKERLEDILMKTLTRHVDKRYVSIEDLMRDLEDFAGHIASTISDDAPGENPLQQKVRAMLFGTEGDGNQEYAAGEAADDEPTVETSLGYRFPRQEQSGEYDKSIIWSSREKLRGETWLAKLNPTVVMIIIAALMLIGLLFIRL